MNLTEIQLVPLETSDREQFIRDNQEAFKNGLKFKREYISTAFAD